MRHALISLVTVAASFAASRAVAAPSAPSAAELCALALQNRPTEQLQERQGCEVVQTRAVPKGALKRAVVVRVPLNEGTVDLLMIEVAAKGGKTAWQDLGPVAGQTGKMGDMRFDSTLESLEVRPTTGGPRVIAAVLQRRSMGDGGGRSIVVRHEWLVCGADGTEVVCVSLADRVSLAVEGDMADLTPYAWTRTVTVDAAGAITVGQKTGTGEAGPFDPGPGTHTLTSLSDTPTVRLYPVTPWVHPDALKDDPPLALPE